MPAWEELSSVALNHVLELTEGRRADLEVRPVSNVNSAQAGKRAAPNDVFHFDAAWSITDPVEGTMCQ